MQIEHLKENIYTDIRTPRQGFRNHPVILDKMLGIVSEDNVVPLLDLEGPLDTLLDREGLLNIKYHEDLLCRPLIGPEDNPHVFQINAQHTMDPEATRRYQINPRVCVYNRFSNIVKWLEPPELLANDLEMDQEHLIRFSELSPSQRQALTKKNLGAIPASILYLPQEPSSDPLIHSLKALDIIAYNSM